MAWPGGVIISYHGMLYLILSDIPQGDTPDTFPEGFQDLLSNKTNIWANDLVSRTVPTVTLTKKTGRVQFSGIPVNPGAVGALLVTNPFFNGRFPRYKIFNLQVTTAGSSDDLQFYPQNDVLNNQLLTIRYKNVSVSKSLTFQLTLYYEVD